MKQKDLLILAAGLLIGAGFAIFIYWIYDLSSMDGEVPDVLQGVNLPESAAIGFPAPDFELNDIAGKTFRLRDLRGKIVIINFWATWCEPCKFEMPVFEELFSKPQNQVQILAVNFDEPRPKVQEFVEEFQLSFPVLLDPGGAVQKLYRVLGYPTTFILNEEGIVRYHHIGLISKEQLYQYLSSMGVNE